MRTSEIPLLLYVTGFLVWASVPAGAVGLAMVFDRLLGRRSIPLGVLGTGLALAGSLVLVVLLQPPGFGIGLTWFPVALAALPVLLQVVLGGRSRVSPGGTLVGAVYVASIAVLVVWMYLLMAALVGFLYLPAIAALSAAALRHKQAAETEPATSGRRSWLLPGLLLSVPLLAILSWSLLLAQMGTGTREAGGEIRVRSTPSRSPGP